MFARFTAQASEAMVLAREESARLRYPWLGTEHLLLGLLRQRSTVATNVLEGFGITSASVERELIRSLGPPGGEQTLGEDDERAHRTLGIDLRVVRAQIEEAFGPGALEQARSGQCGLPMMPRLKQSLERAAREAGHGMIDTDHLLLGMLNVRGALAVEILRVLGATPDAVRASVLVYRAQAS
jgi:ATP-dependent Clp protease ATP-binding subunit ClpA